MIRRENKVVLKSVLVVAESYNHYYGCVPIRKFRITSVINIDMWTHSVLITSASANCIEEFALIFAHLRMVIKDVKPAFFGQIYLTPASILRALYHIHIIIH